MEYDALIAVAGIALLLAGWVAVQRCAARSAPAHSTAWPEARRDPPRDACLACGGTCGAPLPPPAPSAETGSVHTKPRT